MGKFIKITGIKYKNDDLKNRNKVDKTYQIIVNSDYIHNIQEVLHVDNNNGDYIRYNVATIANNSISIHYVSKEHFDLLETSLNSEFGIIIIS